jgi:NADH-quinone oxidoreductase subunit M
MTASMVVVSLIVFLPAAVALLLALFLPGNKPEWAKAITLATTVAVLLLNVWMLVPGAGNVEFQANVAQMQQVFNVEWIPAFDIQYFMGTDGISFPLVLLTTALSVLAMWTSWNITKHVKAYCVLFLLLETGMVGVFFALDFFLFYVFWEVMLLPMYFLIGFWGGPRREYAAIKFFLYTLLGSVLMLVAILMLYFTSDLRSLHADEGVQKIAWTDLHLHTGVIERAQAVGRARFDSPTGGHTELSIAVKVPGIIGRNGETGDFNALAVNFAAGEGLKAGAETVAWDPAGKSLTFHIEPGQSRAADVVKALERNTEVSKLFSATISGESGPWTTLSPNDGALLIQVPGGDEVHTFNILALSALGQRTDLFSNPGTDVLGASIQTWAFLLLFVGFVIKVPVVPVHTWLPDAHVEAPTPISMILAGVLLKMGGYGILRICYPICPSAGYHLAWLVVGIGVLSMVYGAFAAMAQKDFKRLVAYSSVSHMGYVILGMGVWSSTAMNSFETASWQYGMNGAMFQMIAHGISSAGMFFLVGVIYDRVHHRNLDEFGGLMAKMPVYGGLSIGIFFAALGLPGLCGFIGEVFVTLSVWNYSGALAVISASVVILTAGYILWTIQRVLLGPEYKGPHGEALSPMTYREVLIGAPLLAFAILLGVYPNALLRYMSPSVNQVVTDMTEVDRREGWSAAELASPARATAAAGDAESESSE